jgi:CheY-specific phosphatase CheX
MSDNAAEENKTKILEALQVSVVEIMNTMAMTEVIYTGIETANTFSVKRQVTGLVRLMGAHNGMLAISCSLELLQATVSNIIGIAIEDLQQEDLLDGASELANMVGGGMKSKAQIPGVVLSPPMSIIGDAYMAEWKTDRQTDILTFQMEEGILQVYTSL